MDAALRTPPGPATAALPDMLHGTVCTPTTFGVLALPSSGITRPANLAGKTIAVNLTNNVQTLTANTMLKAAGVNPSSVHYVAGRRQRNPWPRSA